MMFIYAVENIQEASSLWAFHAANCKKSNKHYCNKEC